MLKEYIECSFATRQSQEDIICSVSPIDVQISIELNEPWSSVPSKSETFLHHKHLFEVLPSFFKEKIKSGVNHFAQNEFSLANHTRIFYFQKTSHEFSAYKKIELLVPNHEFKEAIYSLKDYQLENKNDFKKWEVTLNKDCREVFICTHAERDNCCGKYGLQIFNKFKEENSKLEKGRFRIWKSSHIGGHRYAPTFFEAPSMRWYGLFNIEDVPHFLNRVENNFQIENNYRGFSGINSSFVQMAEKELFKKYSWQWDLAQNKNYEIILSDDCSNATVLFYFSFPDANGVVKKIYDIQFEKLITGIASCGSDDSKSVKQYKIVEIIE
ncbi:sucrase ferredoxin [Fluviispira multicolorata]|nr:sucrase ferredoxin [Fluviispira multicolorata]